jgi:hypothetical protein
MPHMLVKPDSIMTVRTHQTVLILLQVFYAQNLLLLLLYCQTPIQGQTWELTLFSQGNNKNKKNNDPTQILPEWALLGF